jgi:hypothetical protein
VGIFSGCAAFPFCSRPCCSRSAFIDTRIDTAGKALFLVCFVCRLRAPSAAAVVRAPGLELCIPPELAERASRYLIPKGTCSSLLCGEYPWTRLAMVRHALIGAVAPYRSRSLMPYTLLFVIAWLSAQADSISLI